uniref:Ionotropic glutamate receptor C-terminal domain-containing protein n=1 Tax=Dendroctonus ponderosae TaxID=77166 RepID=A0AAR5NYW9_DENPD
MPGAEIQDELLKLLHKSDKYTIEVLQYGRTDFQSYSSNCPTDAFEMLSHSSDCIRKHVKQMKTTVYLIVMDDVEMMKSKLENIAETSSFNRDALCIIYYSKIGNKNNFVTGEIISYLYDVMVITKIVIMMPINLTTFETYIFKIDNQSGMRCFSKSAFKIQKSYQCNQGILATNGTNIFQTKKLKNDHQCYTRVHALPYEPFVISNLSGIETDVINEIGKVLNISIHIKLYLSAPMDLGEKCDNGNWTGFLAPVYDSWHLGIGNVPPESEYMDDFTFTLDYIRAKIVYVVPNANLVPSWRTFMVIFNIEIWGICLLAIISFAVAFRVLKTKSDDRSFRTLQKCFAVAFQILIAHPIEKQPKSDFTRVYFIALAMLSIVLNSVYTSSMIYFLQNPIREHQISTDKEIANHLPLGSSPKYKEMSKSSNQFAKVMHDSYITVNKSLDTNNDWIAKVGNERNICTLGIEINLNYLLSKKNRLVTDKFGNDKVFVLEKPLRSQPVGIIMRKGNFFLDNFNSVIQKLIIEAGIIEKIKSKYLQSTVHSMGDHEMSENNNNVHSSSNLGQSALSTHHLEGAFAILALGEVCGFLVFAFEIVYCRVLAKMNT